jgi:hypothetical protein
MFSENDSKKQQVSEKILIKKCKDILTEKKHIPIIILVLSGVLSFSDNQVIFIFIIFSLKHI